MWACAGAPPKLPDDVETGLLLRSRFAQALNVLRSSTPWAFTRCGLATRPF